jgi:hypothetical protein
MSNERDDFDDDYLDTVRPHRGPMILTFGILGVMTCTFWPLGVFAIVAWVLGKRDLDLIRRGQMDKEGESLTKTGYILGIVGTILFLLLTVIMVAYFTFIIIMIASH